MKFKNQNLKGALVAFYHNLCPPPTSQYTEGKFPAAYLKVEEIGLLSHTLDTATVLIS